MFTSIKHAATTLSYYHETAETRMIFVLNSIVNDVEWRYIRVLWGFGAATVKLAL